MEVIVGKSFFKSIKNLDSLKNKWYEITSWFKYHFNRDFWRIIITALKGYPWQESFLYELEKVKIQEMINYHKKGKRFVGVEYVIRDMQICLNLINIMENETNLFDYDGNLYFSKISDDNYEIKKSDDFKYKCLVNVNTKNIDRFIKDGEVKKHYINKPHEFYLLKAKYLYHKIRYEHDAEWWD